MIIPASLHVTKTQFNSMHNITVTPVGHDDITGKIDSGPEQNNNKKRVNGLDEEVHNIPVAAVNECGCWSWIPARVPVTATAALPSHSTTCLQLIPSRQVGKEFPRR
jgi:hypothetical protein